MNYTGPALLFDIYYKFTIHLIQLPASIDCKMGLLLGIGLTIAILLAIGLYVSISVRGQTKTSMSDEKFDSLC